ncbi:MAG: hypothetical protein SGILL_003007 [Bacillariaceae sp.]
MTSEESYDAASAMTPVDNVEASFQDEAATTASSRKKLHYEPNIEKGSSYRLSENVGPSDVDHKQLLVAILGFMFVAAIGVGIGFAVKNNSSDASATSAAVAPASCSFQPFETDSLKLTMVVKNDLSEDDIEYAGGVFQKTYLSLLQEELAESGEEFCDPYCRSIVSVNATANEVLGVEEGDNTTVAEAKQAEECDKVIELTLSVEGMYWSCDDMEFPGLFSMADGGERRGLQSLIQNNLRSRFLAPDDDSCPVCSEDSSTIMEAPSQEELIKNMQVYVAILPSICELDSVQVV